MLNLLRLTRFSWGKIWFGKFDPCKRIDILQLCGVVEAVLKNLNPKNLKAFVDALATAGKILTHFKSRDAGDF